MKIAEAENLSVELGGSKIIENVNFQIAKGDVAVIIGPNGSGKSTLLKALLGLTPAATGHAHLFGHPSNKLGAKEKRKIGYVAQRFNINKTFPITVAEFLRLMFFGLGYSKIEEDKMIHSALRKVHAERLIDRQVGVLSGGETQRVLIARAIINNPEVLILDEPTAGVDIGGEETLYQLVDELHDKEKLTIIMVSHDLNVVYKYASTVICLNQEMVCFGAPKEVLNDKSLKALYGDGMAIYHHEHGGHK